MYPQVRLFVSELLTDFHDLCICLLLHVMEQKLHVSEQQQQQQQTWFSSIRSTCKAHDACVQFVFFIKEELAGFEVVDLQHSIVFAHFWQSLIEHTVVMSGFSALELIIMRLSVTFSSGMIFS